MAQLIELTKDDLDEGKPYQSDCCPVALAATRTLKRPCRLYYSIIMGRAKAWLHVDLPFNEYAIVPLESGIAKWAEYWDKTQMGRLFSFHVEMGRNK